MKKIFRIDVDCANCASKMEAACSRLEGVGSVSINFMTQKIAIEFADGASVPEVLKSILKACRKVDRHCEIY